VDSARDVDPVASPDSDTPLQTSPKSIDGAI